ncbi:protein Wnt-2 [Neocloeon triangulifer]|uniref:protein Wnt-2 n=1 Tax=Neocloeon triangulifer TaxID=2078957 RepID=UPI00286EFC12|nr:protein Wnt-2 [Neocloeon triangulifer]
MWLEARKGPDKPNHLPRPASAVSWQVRVLCVLCAATLLQTVGNLRVVSSVVAALGAHVICARIPGLTPRQRDLCRTTPDAIAAVSEGARLGTLECRYQFRNQRWNCSTISSDAVFGHVMVVGSREAAFTYAIASAGVTYAVTQACSRGNISSCGCAPSLRAGMVASGTPMSVEDVTSPAGWKWGGCSADVGYGVRFARKFVDARELEGDERTLMNLHNNKAGRKAVKVNLLTECKCHGVSGSCTLKTCWKTLPPFRRIGDYLMKKYIKARTVHAISSSPGKRSGPNSVSSEPSGLHHHQGYPRAAYLALRRPTGEAWPRRQGTIRRSPPVQRRPKRAELVFLHQSPNYCERDLARGSLGTTGRTCNRSSTGTEGCEVLCCGRGYNTHQYTRHWQCRCKFHWCCYVECAKCSERTEEYTCK